MKTTFQKFSLYHRGQKSSSFVLKALPSALALVFSQAGWADPPINAGGAAGLPLNGAVTSGAATGSVAGNQLSIDQTTGRAVIDWTSFSIAAGKSVLFNQPNASSAVLNRVGAGADASQIMGSLQANGTVMLMNPNGVMFGVGSAVNVGSLIATTGTIQESNFLTTGGAIISGATGSITSQGNITATAGASGLVALVAPSVINQGSITATGGKIALAGSTAATISLNGGLYEFAIPAGATGVQVSNTASASLNAANIHLGVGDAANLLSGVINLEGVQQATNAIVVNGHTVELKSALQAPSVSGSSNVVNVSSGARIQDAVKIAKTGMPGAGGTVNVGAGTYAEQVVLNKANMTIAGREGASLNVAEGQTGFEITANGVTVEGMQITGPYSQNFTTVNWNAAPTTTGITVKENVSGVRIHNNSIKNVRTGVQVLDHAAVEITGNTFDNTKGSILVRSDNVTMSGNARGPSGNEWDIVFLNHVTNGAYFTSPHVSQTQYGSDMMAMSRTNGDMHILDRRYGSNGLLGSTPQFGNRSHIVVSAGSNFTAVDDFNLGNGLGNARQPLGFIGDGINAVVSGGVVEVKAGTYAESLSITKALTLQGAGAGQSVITPAAGDAVTVSGNIGASAEVLIDGFTFRNAPGSGVRVANNTVLNKLTVQNSDFLHNGKFGFFADGLATAGIPGLQNVSLLNSTFTGNGAPYTSATSLGQGDINFNYYNGNARLKDLRITGENEFVGIQFRGYHNNVSSGGVHDAGTLVFDNVTIDGNFRRPIGSAGTWNPQGPGDAFHLLEYGSVANVSFHNVAINPTVGHGMFLEGLGSTLDIGNTRFGVPDSSIAGVGTNPTRSWNIYAGSNDRNNAKTNVNATRASFTGAANGFAIEDRVHHALDVAGLGVVSWEAGNLYVTQASGSIQRGVDAAGVGNTVNVAAGAFAENVALNNRYNLLFNDTRLHSLTLNGGAAGSGIGGAVTADGAGGFKFNAPVNLLADTTLTTLGADISFNGDIQNANGVARALRLIAGSGGTRGNVHLTTGGSAASPLGRFDVSANQFSLASTLWVRSYKIDALGDITLSNSTLRAQDTGAASTLNAGGDVTGSTISQGSVEVISAGDIEANIAGTDVVAQAQGAMDVVVTASQTATLTADTIVANITAADVVAQSRGDMNVVVTASNSASLAGDSVVANVTAPVVAVEAVNDAQISGAASQITLDAPRGSVSGSFGQISNTGGGLINVNGKPQGNQTLSSNSENNRVVPTGGVLDNGAEGAGLQLAQAGGAALQGGSDIVLSTPEAAGDAVDSGRAVELDMSPRKRGQDKNTEKDKEKE